MQITQRLANELAVREQQVAAAIQLIDEGSTVPFIARYRKEVTGGLDDSQLRLLEERLIYMRELDERRVSVIKSIDEQNKLTPQLKTLIMQADTKIRLEDLYAPYKQKKRTKAQIAREAGIEPLVEQFINDSSVDLQQTAQQFINVEKAYDSVEKVMDGARYIIAERFVENAELIGQVRQHMWDDGILTSELVEGHAQTGAKFADYFEFGEPIHKMPSHRVLALLRGRKEGVLKIKLTTLEQQELTDRSQLVKAERMLAQHVNSVNGDSEVSQWLRDTARWSWRVKVSMQVETDLMLQTRTQAEAEAIRVFGGNLRDLLLAAPAGAKVTMGLDPGLRTGTKLVVVDETGKVLEYDTIYPHAPQKQWTQSMAAIVQLVKKHGVNLISIGNGTASRETDRLVKDIFKAMPELAFSSLMVSEAGASVYSASELASKEFPDLDVTIRGAVSIARRLQDPLAELVKISPKSIGVGQYQHDVNQTKLSRALDGVVEDCVNAVGVDVNTASAPLLARVAGLNEALASNVVLFREQHGAFKSRKEFLKVPRIGPKAYEQCAGFLRIMNAVNPLDASAVHPEAYPVVEQIVAKQDIAIEDVIGNSQFLHSLNASDYTDDQFGEPTIKDIIQELNKPGRDPRPEFKTAEFKDGIEEISDLKEGMRLQGVVTNVTNFGAFIDIGVHQDGLVHISALSDTFVKDPREVVKAGDVVKVKVIEIDIQRRRIALTMKSGVSNANTEKHSPNKSSNKNVNKAAKNQHATSQSGGQTAMASAFAKLKNSGS